MQDAEDSHHSSPEETGYAAGYGSDTELVAQTLDDMKMSHPEQMQGEQMQGGEHVPSGSMEIIIVS